jgi:molybdenum cofactor cytidylyltransferase
VDVAAEAQKPGQCRQDAYGKSSIRPESPSRLRARQTVDLWAYVMMSTVVRGVILAAGASSRMGRPKFSLPLGTRGDTFLSRIIRTLTTCGIPEIVVVSGSTVDVRPAAHHVDRRVRFVHNPEWSMGQLTSLLTALDRVSGAGAGDGVLEAVMMTLVDVPLVSETTCRRVLAAWRATRAPIVRPAQRHRHGHPVIFDRAIFDELRRADPQQGAKAVVRMHELDIVNVEVDDEYAFLDVDTPEEYRRLTSTERGSQSAFDPRAPIVRPAP